MDTIFSARYLVAGDLPPLEGGAILVRNGIIEARGHLPELRRCYPAAKVVTFDDGLMVPLLVNAHTHLELTDFSDWLKSAEVAIREDQPTDFVAWILRLIKIKSRLKPASYQTSLLNGIHTSIAAGTGAVGDILAHYPAAESYRNSSLAGSLFFEVLGQEPERIRQAEKKLAQVLQDFSLPSIQPGMSPHSPCTIKQDWLRRIYRDCRVRGLRCTTHLAESPEEVDFIEQGRGRLAEILYPFVGWETFLPRPSGLRPVVYLERLGGLFPGNLLVHGVQLIPDEIELLAKKGMSLVLCPRSNAQLNVGKAAAGRLLRAGVRLALGTDSLASCDSLSIWDEMAFAHQWFAGELDAPTLFRMATQGGAEVLGLGSLLGSLSVGKEAGFQVLLPRRSVAAGEIYDYFMTPGCTQDIVQVYHKGRSVIREEK